MSTILDPVNAFSLCKKIYGHSLMSEVGHAILQTGNGGMERLNNMPDPTANKWLI